MIIEDESDRSLETKQTKDLPENLALESSRILT